MLNKAYLLKSSNGPFKKKLVWSERFFLLIHRRQYALVCCCLLVGGLLSAIVFAGLERWPGFSRVLPAQLAFGDFLVFLSPKPQLPFQPALIGIDSSSWNLDQIEPSDIAASRALTLMKEGYPWSREVYAIAFERLSQAGARLVLLDILLRGARQGDEHLRQILEKNPKRFVLVSTFVDDASGTGHVIMRYQPPALDIIPSNGGNIGFANFWRDLDGVVRVAPFRLKRPGTNEQVDSAPAVMLQLLAGKARVKKLPAQSAFIPGIEALHTSVIPLWKIFDEKTWHTELKNGAVFRDKIVAIGAYYADAHDEFQTPVGVIPGMALHLSALAAAWQGAFYMMPTRWAMGASCFFSALAALGVSLACRRVVIRFLLFGAGVALFIIGGVAILVFFHTLIPLLPLLAGFLCSGVAGLLIDLLAESQARRRARHALERYVSRDVAHEILDNRRSFLQSLGGVRRDITVAFVDLRGFTRLSEAAEPVELIAELNDYLGRMTNVILTSGGGVDKFLGDGIMAVWGALGRREPHVEAASAISCAQEMLVELEKINTARLKKGLPQWHMGIGIHSGPAVFGNVGSVQKMEPTVIGDTVNLASRTESLTKVYQLSLLITKAAQNLSCLDTSLFRSVDQVRVMGRAQAVEMFTFWEKRTPFKERQQYEDAIAFYRKGEFTSAKELFQKLSDAAPEDPLYTLYRDRCCKLIEHPPAPASWDGITQAASK